MRAFDLFKSAACQNNKPYQAMSDFSRREAKVNNKSQHKKNGNIPENILFTIKIFKLSKARIF